MKTSESVRLETIERRLGSYQTTEQLLKTGIEQRDQLIADQLAEIESLKSQIAVMQGEQPYCTFKDTGLSEIDALCIQLLSPFPPNDAELNKAVAILRKLESQNKTLKRDFNLFDKSSIAIELTKWNRGLDTPPIKIAHELGVAFQVLEILEKVTYK